MAPHQRVAGAHDLHFAQVTVVGAIARVDAGYALAGFGQQALESAVLPAHGRLAARDDELFRPGFGERAIDLLGEQALDDALAVDEREQRVAGGGFAALGRDQVEAGAEAVERDHDLQAGIHAVRDLGRWHGFARVVARDQLLDRLGADLQIPIAGRLQALAQP